MNKKHLTRAVLLTALLAACGKGPTSPSSLAAASDPPTCKAGVAAFTKTVFPLVREHCALCHDGTGNGPAIGPAFAVNDPTESYDRIRARMNFANVQGSLFVVTGGNKHCLSRGGPADCGMTHDQVLSAVQSWWTAGENSCSALGSLVTAKLPLPANLPSAADGFQSLRWDLSSFGPNLQGVLFEIQAQHFAVPSASTKGAYRFREPRLGTTVKPIVVQGIKLAINGSYDPRANEYADVHETVMPQPMPKDASAPLPAPSLSPFTLILLQDKPTGDTLQIGFDSLDVGTALQCKALDQFQRVLDVMAARDCYACHAGGPDHEPGIDPARQRLAMTGSVADLCAAALERSDKANPQTSVFLSYPLRGSDGHPKVFTGTAEVEPAFEAWLAAELAP